MSFIRATRKGSEKQIELNSDHVIGIENSGTGAIIYCSNNLDFDVNETPSQLRSFILKAQGKLPEKTNKGY